MYVEIVLLLVVVVFALYLWAVKNNDYFSKRDIPYLKPTLFFGSAKKFIFNQIAPNDFIEQMYNAMPTQGLYGFFMFRTPTLFARDPQIIKLITVKEFDHFADHQSLLRTVDNDMFAKSLIMLNGEKWRHMRSTLSPVFTGSKMRQMFELVSDCSAGTCAALTAQGATALESLDMKDLFSRYANDVIATTAFGIGVNSFENEQNEFLVNGRKMLNANKLLATIKILIISWFPWIANKLDMQMMDGQMIKFFKSMVIETMEMRQREKIHRPDVINLLMQLRRGDDLTATALEPTVADGFATADNEQVTTTKATVKRTLTDDEIVAQCFLFFVAGFDTISTALSTLSYELAINPDVQDRLHEECAAVQRRLTEAGIEKLPYDVLQEMAYMDQVVSESLRMWPPALFTERMCVKDYAYDDGELRFRVDEKTSVWIPLTAIHRDGQYFKEPQRFDPDRFSAERKGDIVPGTYMPFGQGPRNCIASRFALMEMKAAIYHMVLHFRFEPCEKTQIPLKLAKNPGAFLTEKGIHLTMKIRDGKRV